MQKRNGRAPEHTARRHECPARRRSARQGDESGLARELLTLEAHTGEGDKRRSMPTKPSREALRRWPSRAGGVPCSEMGVRCAAVVTALGGLLLATAACAQGGSSTQISENEIDVAAPRVPDQPPRSRGLELDSDSGTEIREVPAEDEQPKLRIKCEGHEPYVCMLDDGSFRCSDRPCVPSCDRVGCLRGEFCLPCDGGFRCVAPGDTC